MNVEQTFWKATSLAVVQAIIDDYVPSSYHKSKGLCPGAAAGSAVVTILSRG